MNKRRKLIAALGATALAAPVSAIAQQGNAGRAPALTEALNETKERPPMPDITFGKH